MSENRTLLSISAKVALVPLVAAASSLGLHVDDAIRAVESGEWPYVFDLAAGRGEIRELRVWSPCITDEDRVRGMTAPSHLAAVITDAIGTASGDVRGAALETRWQISNQTLRRLLAASEIQGRITGRTLWLSRASLVSFLERRRVL